jgi:hypothetical protein
VSSLNKMAFVVRTVEHHEQVQQAQQKHQQEAEQSQRDAKSKRELEIKAEKAQERVAFAALMERTRQRKLTFAAEATEKDQAKAKEGKGRAHGEALLLPHIVPICLCLS